MSAVETACLTKNLQKNRKANMTTDVVIRTYKFEESTKESKVAGVDKNYIKIKLGGRIYKRIER